MGALLTSSVGVGQKLRDREEEDAQARIAIAEGRVELLDYLECSPEVRERAKIAAQLVAEQQRKAKIVMKRSERKQARTARKARGKARRAALLAQSVATKPLHQRKGPPAFYVPVQDESLRRYIFTAVSA
jgi:hypothetical protein